MKSQVNIKLTVANNNRTFYLVIEPREIVHETSTPRPLTQEEKEVVYGVMKKHNVNDFFFLDYDIGAQATFAANRETAVQIKSIIKTLESSFDFPVNGSLERLIASA